MPSIFAYQKYIDALITRELQLPVDASNQRLGTELATLDGITYVSLPDGVTLPAEQPPEIAASVLPVTLDTTLRDAIANASPHARLIRSRVAAAIAEQYSIGDEIKLLRTAPSPEFDAYNAFVEDRRAWGRGLKVELGL